MSSRSIFESHRMTLAVLVLLSILGISVALADDQSDPPGRVARLSYADGSVSMQPAGVDDWTNATLNRPLTIGDKLWTDQSSRAELDIGTAVIRLGSTTGVSFLNLDDRTVQMNLSAGTVIMHVRERSGDQLYEVDTPNVALGLESPGDYRIEVNDAGDTTVVKVDEGDVEVTASGQTVALHTQQASVFTGTEQVTADATSVGAPDALDSWSLDRDRQSEQAEAQSSEYVPPDMPGTDALADNGTWQTTPDYGPVWVPTVVAAGWSPYHYGRWVWVAPWGWTWVDDAPWGFAPFHYGRWAYYGTHWCWVPGPRQMRPVYAPALVAWVGSPGASVSVAVGGGAGVGWFPLGPREVYVPAYHVSQNYVRNVNITNTTIVNNTYITNVYENKVTNVTYVNRNRPGAVVAVSQDTFTSGRPISANTIRIPSSQLTQLGSRPVAPAIVPARESVLASRPGINVRRPPAAFMNRPVVARTAPPSAPVPFARQQEAIRANGGLPLGRSQIAALQPATAANTRVRVVAPGPVRPIQSRGPGNGAQYGTATMQERERTLHATPISPPQPGARPTPGGPGETGSFGTNRAPAFRSDRPPAAHDTAAEAHPAEPRQFPQARPLEQERPAEQQRPMPQAHPIEPQRALPQAHPIEQPRPEYQQPRQEYQQPRQEYRAPEPPRATPEPPRAVEQPRPEARPIEPPHAAPPPPPPRQAPPPQRTEEHHSGKPGDPRR